MNKLYMYVGRAQNAEVWPWRPLRLSDEFEADIARSFIGMPFSDGCYDADAVCERVVVLEVELFSNMGIDSQPSTAIFMCNRKVGGGVEESHCNFNFAW